MDGPEHRRAETMTGPRPPRIAIQPISLHTALQSSPWLAAKAVPVVLAAAPPSPVSARVLDRGWLGGERGAARARESGVGWRSRTSSWRWWGWARRWCCCGKTSSSRPPCSAATCATSATGSRRSPPPPPSTLSSCLYLSFYLQFTLVSHAADLVIGPARIGSRFG